MKAFLAKIFEKLPLIRDSTVELYTDGSFKNGRGSWAFVAVRNGCAVQEASGCSKQTTSLRMEIQAAIEAIKSIPEKSRAVLYTDCRILTEFVFSGKKCETQTPNADLLIELVRLNESKQIEWKWVRAHSGVVFNERCDQLCKAARAN